MEDSMMLPEREIKKVQDLIELCLQKDMTREETVTLISERQKQFRADFIDLVWGRLEQENREFFEAYHVRLMLKLQILHFNNLLKRQVELMNQIQSSEPSCPSVSNGSNVKPIVQQSSGSVAAEDTRHHIKPECFQPILPSSFPGTYDNGIMHPGHGILPIPSGNIGAFEPSAQSCEMGAAVRINGGMVKSEMGYSYNPQAILGTNGNVLAERSDIVDASIPCFYDVRSSQALNEQFFNLDKSSALLEQPPRSLPFSEFSDFPSFGADSDEFLHSPDEHHELADGWNY
ncbi:hypothetical protein AKJ16_DCAP22913 [Drosera capensis]